MSSARCCAAPTASPCCPSAAQIRVLIPEWGLADVWGMVCVRLGFRRMSYGMPPGLYAMGTPTTDSPVLVTANYKLTVDVLRRELRGRAVWILVLDTASVNVWCAAGKGTFGTAELVRQIAATRLTEQVTHRRLILPQLGAPGVAAHEVTKATGFRVAYGPVRAQDLPAFLDGGEQATAEMRRVDFPLLARLVLAPIELRHHLLPALIVALVLGALPGVVRGHGGELGPSGWQGLAAVLATWLGGCLLGPALLPWLPGRAFWVKGAWLGAALALAGAGMAGGLLPAAGGVLWMGAGVSFLLMNFTGCTTFTSQSGVKVELRAIPGQIAAGAIGLLLWSLAWWR